MNQENGFTLIETMVAVAVAGVVAVIAVPQYQTYLAKGQASEAFALMEGVKADVIESVVKNNSCIPSSGATIQGKYGVLTITGAVSANALLYPKTLLPTGCTFTYVMKSTNVYKQIANKSVIAHLFNNGVLSKETTTTVNAEYLPRQFTTLTADAIPPAPPSPPVTPPSPPVTPPSPPVTPPSPPVTPPSPPVTPPSPPVTPPSPPVTSPSPPVTPPPSGGTGSTSPTTPDVSVLPNPSLTSTAGWYKDANLTTLVGSSTNRRDTYVVFDLKNVKGGEVLELTGTDYNELTVFTIDVTLLGDSSKLTSPIGFNTLYALYKSPQRGNIPIRTIPITIPQGITGNVRLVFKSSALTAHHTLDRGASRFDFILKHNNVQIGEIATVYRS